MITMAELSEFLGWALVINVSFFMLSFLGATFLRTKILQIHSKMFGLCEVCERKSCKYIAKCSDYARKMFRVPIFNLWPSTKWPF
jgi:hypothetical protein